MSELTRVMVDIETLGLDIGAAIVSIGAVVFDETGVRDDDFRGGISLESCQDAGLRIDAGTLEWWLGQDAGVREQLAGGGDLHAVLSEFRDWYVGHEPDEVWANSPSFDCEMLEYAGDAVGIEMPWAFYEERDVRTLTSLSVAPDWEQDGEEHDVLADARYQARVVGESLRRLDEAEDVDGR